MGKTSIRNILNEHKLNKNLINSNMSAFWISIGIGNFAVWGGGGGGQYLSVSDTKQNLSVQGFANSCTSC